MIRLIQTSAVGALIVLLAYLPLYHPLFEINIHSLPYLPNMKGIAAITTTPAAPQTNSAMSAITHPTSPFLRLPAELRNKIYTFIGLSTSVVLFELPKHPCSRTITPILSTCKQIRSEATALIYANATFEITRGYEGFYWTRFCPNVKSCTRLQISWAVSCEVAGYVHANGGRSVVCPLPNLERVEVMCASKRGSAMIRGALREWIGKENLVVEFRDLEGMLTPW